VFATLLGRLPRPSASRDGEGRDAHGRDLARDGDGEGRGLDLESSIEAAVRAQEDAGLEPITDGRLRGELSVMELDPAAVVAAWRFVAALTDRGVKQALPGPYSLGQRRTSAERGAATAPSTARATAGARAAATLRAADDLRAVVEALAGAGCPMIEIEETTAHLIGSDAVERALFRDAHRRLAEGVLGTHLSLSIVGGNAWEVGLEAMSAAPYASLAVDLIHGPDNWNLVTRLAGERGVIAGALPAKASPADAREMLVWAARYAAGSNGRGLERVGIGSAGSWANLAWAAAVEKMQRLGGAARLAATPGGAALARQLDPRSVSARTAATGYRAIRPESEA
jgi:methionine synthase II (cobalamin-independent)